MVYVISKMFPLRQVIRSVSRVLPNVRPMSAKAEKLVDLAIDDEGVAVMTMQRLPVNSLNLDLLQEMSKALDDAAKNKARALILTSASPTVFSAGLDIMEMHKPNLKRVEEFWTTLQEVWIKLFGCNFISAAAINGHSPAGGCLLAMSCEYRVMVSGKYSIGLNETQLGIVAPNWFIDTMRNTIPVRETEIALTTGKLFSVDEALKVGLIDETATDKADAIAKCRKFISKFERIPPMARALTKQKLRAGPLNRMNKTRKEDLQEFITFVTNPKIQQALEMYLIMMKEKANK